MTTTTGMVETFKARREVNLGWCKRQAGDFIPEYTDPNEITPMAVERLIRQNYIERRTVPQSELDEWQAKWDAAHPKPAEGSEIEEGESSEEEEVSAAVIAEQEAAVVNPLVEESIEDLGEPEPEEKKPTKRVVRSNTSRGNRRRSGNS